MRNLQTHESNYNESFQSTKHNINVSDNWNKENDKEIVQFNNEMNKKLQNKSLHNKELLNQHWEHLGQSVGQNPKHYREKHDQRMVHGLSMEKKKNPRIASKC